MKSASKRRPGLFVPLPLDLADDHRTIGLGVAARYLYMASLIQAKRCWQTNGVLMGSLLPRFCHPLSVEEARAAAEALVAAGLWAVVEGGWQIVDWLLWNDSAEEAEGLSQKRQLAGEHGAEVRWQGQPPAADPPEEPGNGNLPSAAHSKADGKGHGKAQGKVDGKQHGKEDGKQHGSCTSASASGSCCTEGGAGGRVPRTVPQRPAAGAPAACEPDDPSYQLDAQWSGEKELAYWQQHLGKIPGGQYPLAQSVLIRLHQQHQVSLTQVRALVKHVVTHEDARAFWGTGKSPATWLDNKTGSEPTWLKIRAHALRCHAYPVGAPANAIRAPDPGPDPGVDPACECRRGWVEDHQLGATVFCAKCARGRWLKAGGREK